MIDVTVNKVFFLVLHKKAICRSVFMKRAQRSEGKLNICKPSKEHVRMCKDYIIGREITTLLKKPWKT